MSFAFLVLCCDVRYSFRIKTMFGSSLPPVVCRCAHVLFTLCLFAHSGVQHILCCVLCLVFLHLVYHILPVSLDCPFLIAPSIFCTIYLNFIFFLNEKIYLFWKQTISHLIKSLKNVRKSNINYCKCTIEKVHETNRMLKPQIWNRMLKSQIWNRMLKSQIWNRMLKSQMCITQVNTSQSKLEI